MNVKKSLSGYLLLGCILAARGQAQTATFTAVADTYLRQAAPNRSHGTESLLRVGTADRTRAIVRFDQTALASGLSGATLLSARLELYVQAVESHRGSGRTVGLHRLTAAWTESGATWICPADGSPANTRPDCSQRWNGGAFTPVPTATVLQTSAASGWITFDVTPDVAAFLAGAPNYGWLLKIADEQQRVRLEYSAREAGSAQAPRLVVTFERPVTDTTAPTIAITSPADGSFVASATPTITASYSDTESGIDPATVRLLLDGIDRTAEAQVSTSGLTFTPVSAIAEGGHVTEILVRDEVRNEGRASASFTTDTMAPSLAITAPAGTVTGDPTPSISISYVDDTSGLDFSSVEILLDGTEITASCTVGLSSALCEPSPLVEGSHTIAATIRDRAGHSSAASSAFLLVLDLEPPSIGLTAPAEGSFLNNSAALVAGTVSDDGQVTSVTVNRVEVPLVDGAFQATVSLSEGVNGILVVATDATGKQSFATRSVTLDLTPPSLSVKTPQPSAITNQTEIRIAGEVTDENGVASLTVAQEVAAVTDDRFETTVSVAPGANLISIHAVDRAGNMATADLQVTRFDLPEVAITSPQDLSFLAATTTDVSGTVDAPGAIVTVNGVAALVSETTSGTTFLARAVPLIEGGNILTATARDATGHMGTDSINVVRDLTAPRLAIHSPMEGANLFEPTVTVSGMVNDIVAGTVNASEATVTVNGRLATVANRSFVVEGIPLAPGDNLLTAMATDASGNVGEARITVHLEPASVPRLSIVSGNHQEAVIGLVLPQPLVVALLDALGRPVVGKPVLFKVRGNNGSLDGGKRRIAVVTDAAGRASSHFTLGTRTGAGSQIVEVTSPGFRGPAVFTATARPGAPASIVVDSGDQQVGITGRELPRPLVAVVIDAGHNRLDGAPIRLEVVRGAGSFAAGLRELLVFSDSDGRVIAPFTLDPEEGIANNVVRATIEGLDPSPVATFVASGRAAGDPAATSISGVVLDNSNQPIAGVTMRVLETALTARTDEKGLFRIAGAPVGTVKLIADGSTVERPGSWPDLEFVLSTIPGRDNTINMPIYLLPLDLQGGLLVDETRGGALKLPEVPGFALDIAPGSVTFPGGSRSGLVSVTVVHSDKIPMVPNFGQQPRFIVTIQPAGARFEPPARLTLPNLEGLAPGEVTEMYSFDHDLGHFVSIGPATVSEDGTVIVSNPGVGIIKAGWHCGGNPATAGTPHACPPCMVCDGSQCVPGCSLGQPQSNILALAACTCNDGNACTVNDTCSGGGCRGERKILFSVEALANGSPTGRVRVNETVKFTTVVTGKHCDPRDLAYEWSFGDGTTSREASPSHKYAKPETYRVDVKVDCKNCDMEKDVVGVVVACPDVRITGSDPDIEVLCPGCEAQFFAESDVPEAPIYWMIPAGNDLGGKAAVSSTGILKIAPDAKTGEVLVRASAVVDGTACRDERTISVFSPPEFPPLEEVPFVEGKFTKAEKEWISSNPCAVSLLKSRSHCSGVRHSIFGDSGAIDSSVGNAFYHAYCSCYAARRCGISAAKELWDAHEKTNENLCAAASIDLHNNEVGRVVARRSGDCKDLVLDALAAGLLRWSATQPPALCPTLESRP